MGFPRQVRGQLGDEPAHRVKSRLRRWRFVVVAVSAVLAALAAPASTQAQAGPYSDHLVGERALGFAGAFAAVGDDASAIFHNPAGMARLRTVAVSGSLWARSFRARRVTGGLVTPYGEGDLSYSSNYALPTFIGAVLKFGKKHAYGRRRHAIGLAVINPHRDEYRHSVTLQNDDGTAVRQLDLEHEDGAYWIGAGYAHSPAPDFHVGASLFFVRHTFEYREYEFSSDDANVAIVGRTASAEATHGRLVVRLGAFYAPSSAWQLGLMAQVPGIAISDDAEVNGLAPDDAMGFVRFQRQAGRAAYGLPWEARLGGSLRPDAPTLLTAEVSLRGGGVAQGFSPGQRAPATLFLPARRSGQMALHAAVGFEWVVSGLLPIRGGVLWSSPNSPSLPATSDRYLREHSTAYGGALSVGWRWDNVDISLGVTAILRDGQALALTRGPAFTGSAYSRTDMTDRSVFLYLAGGSHAVRVAADQVRPLLGDDVD